MVAARDPQLAARTVVGRGVAAVVTASALLGSMLGVTPASASSSASASDVVVSVVVPITAPWGDEGVLDAATLATSTSPTGVLTRELDEVLTTSATIALDPMIPASIRSLGSAAPETAVAWLARLAAAPNETFLLAYADADLTALARTASLDLAQPFDLDFALDPAAFGPAQTATPGPTATPNDDPPPLPTTEELLAWPGTIGHIAWPSEGSATAADLVAYSAAGYDAALLSSTTLAENSTAHVDIDGFSGLVVDAAASGVLREAAATIDPATRQGAVDRLGPALDALAAAHPGRSVVLTLDRTPTFAIPGLAETLESLSARENTRLAGLSAVLGSTAASAAIVDPAPGPAVELAPALTGALRAEQAFATILTEPEQLVVPRQLELLKLLTVQSVDSAGWRAAADEFLRRSAEILESVTIVDTGDVLVTSSSTFVPVRIANALDFPITVRVDARPLRPLLSIESPAEVTVEPASSTTLNLGAQAITNGEVLVEVSISSPATGAPIGRSHLVNADLQAQWETVGIIVGIVVAVVFAVGIVRNVVKRRRGSRRDDESGSATT